MHTASSVFTQTVSALGFELVEVKRMAAGVLRVTIDHPCGAGLQPPPLITTEDCERVTRQLQYALEVQGVDYRRLEVSSPGIDRLLRNEADMRRFVGQVIDVTLKEPIGPAVAQATQMGIGANRRKFRGTLEQTSDGWQVVWSEPVSTHKRGVPVSKKRQAQPLRVLGFVWSEVREARLAPVVDFKGRGGHSPQALASASPQVGKEL